MKNGPGILLPGSRAITDRHATSAGTRCPDGRPHHIVLETPNGTARINGMCKHCGYSRDYAASSDGFDDNFNLSLARGATVRTLRFEQ